MERFASKFYAGIRFADYVFSEPVPLAICVTTPQSMGVYAVLVPDATWGPRHFQPIFFGVFNGQRQSQLTPDDYRRCLRAAAGKQLYVAAYHIPLLGDPSESHRVQRELVHIYSPLCNHDPADASCRMETAAHPANAATNHQRKADSADIPGSLHRWKSGCRRFYRRRQPVYPPSHGLGERHLQKESGVISLHLVKGTGY